MMPPVLSEEPLPSAGRSAALVTVSVAFTTAVSVDVSFNVEVTVAIEKDAAIAAPPADVGRRAHSLPASNRGGRIPAGAGQTSLELAAHLPQVAHPLRCGADPPVRLVLVDSTGSSPQVWGRQEDKSDE